MKKTILLTTIFCLSLNILSAQKYFSKTGKISFYSHTPIEEIEAISNSASTVIDLESGKIQWAVLVKSFEFEKALMQEHFNENYMESSKYPKATFKGEIVGFEKLILSADGTIDLEVKGTLQIHGVEKEITTTANFQVQDSKFSADTKFNVLVADYNIEVPSVVSKNIANEIEIQINADYELLEQ